MKKLFANQVSFIAIVLIFFLSARSHAENTYTTQRGFVFTEVEDKKFGVTWRDPDGLIWSQYQGMFDNSGRTEDSSSGDADFLIIDSPSVRACKKIGGNLPTLDQYKALLRYFLTTSDFRSIFPFPAGSRGLSWTSNAVFPEGGVARFVKIEPYLDSYGDATNSTLALLVLCVHE